MLEFGSCNFLLGFAFFFKQNDLHTIPHFFEIKKIQHWVYFKKDRWRELGYMARILEMEFRSGMDRDDINPKLNSTNERENVELNEDSPNGGALLHFIRNR